jgi:hypothetical protein
VFWSCFVEFSDVSLWVTRNAALGMARNPPGISIAAAILKLCGGDMKLRNIQFENEDACIADIENLRAGARAGGAWSLGQTCWHLNFPVAHSLREPKNSEPTPEQVKRQAFVEKVIASGWPQGASAPKEMVPPADAGDETIDELIASLRNMKKYSAAYVDALLFGPVATSKFRKFALIHAAHHLSFFEPA